jgi:hypothetical protein
VSSITSRITSADVDTLVARRSLLAEITNPLNDRGGSVSVPHNVAESLPRLVQIRRLSVQPTQPRLGVQDRSGDRLVHFGGDRRGQLARSRHAGDMRQLGLRATQRLFGAQLASRLNALGNVASYLGEADQLAAVILDRVDNYVGQEEAAVLAHAPGFGLIPAIARGDFERLLRRIRSAVLLGVEA